MEEKLQQKAPEDSTSSEKEEDESPKKRRQRWTMIQIPTKRTFPIQERENEPRKFFPQ